MNNFKPNLFILGAAKCGTTTLYSILDNHPDICMSKPKEPNFFECEYHKGLDFFKNKYFSHYKNEKYIGEARHRNLYLPFVPERIYNTNPNTKLIITLRNPVDRALSHWWHLYSRNWEKLSFKNALMEDKKRIDQGKKMMSRREELDYCSYKNNMLYYRTYLDSGYYAEQIERYLNFFSWDQILILTLEEINNDEHNTKEKLNKFLEIYENDFPNFGIVKNRRSIPKITPKVVNHTLITKIKKCIPKNIKKKLFNFYNLLLIKQYKMDNNTRKFLIKHYYWHNRKLEGLLNKSFSHWDK